MSADVASFGVMAELETPIPEDRLEEVNDTITEKGFRLNYEGTLIRYLMHEAKDTCHVSSVFSIAHIGFPLRIVGEIKPFVDIWYNGSDDPMDEITLDEFRRIS